MFLDINDIGDRTLEFDERLTLAAVSDDHADLLEAPEVRLHGQVVPGPNDRTPAEGARVAGRLEGRFALGCGRCLERFEFACDVGFRLTLVTQAPDSEDPDHKIDASETHYFEIEEGKLDLRAVAAEQVYLNLPQKPVCQTSCQGLCPTCGINRNRLECDCREETVDPRLQALQEIRDRMGRSEG